MDVQYMYITFVKDPQGMDPSYRMPCVKHDATCILISHLLHFRKLID